MSRGMHRHRSIRLKNLRQTRIDTRKGNAPAKAKAAVRRDARVIAKIKATKAGTGYSAEVQSWLARKLDKPFGKITAEQIKQAIA
ncbi:MAG TPA: hypothetical protein VHX44_16315 [Planctomycetota bacterium]|jgi:hypothetical protein|nr:hypothetical protein [Planctomycetota bacterium]